MSKLGLQCPNHIRLQHISDQNVQNRLNNNISKPKCPNQIRLQHEKVHKQPPSGITQVLFDYKYVAFPSYDHGGLPRAIQ